MPKSYIGYERLHLWVEIRIPVIQIEASVPGRDKYYRYPVVSGLFTSIIYGEIFEFTEYYITYYVVYLTATYDS